MWNNKMSYRNFRSFSNHFFSALLWKCVTGCCLSVQIHFFSRHKQQHNVLFYFGYIRQSECHACSSHLRKYLKLITSLYKTSHE